MISAIKRLKVRKTYFVFCSQDAHHKMLERSAVLKITAPYYMYSTDSGDFGADLFNFKNSAVFRSHVGGLIRPTPP
jgi:hypothetical protein